MQSSKRTLRGYTRFLIKLSLEGGENRLKMIPLPPKKINLFFDSLAKELKR